MKKKAKLMKTITFEESKEYIKATTLSEDEK